ncbi:MAG: hypothetical protein H6981_15560 [Gammaproteobacteria bacterium]|nr:hypothetical protein [Gammaproteobacteria bacterium]MCP5138203.1 hypothetical protein [Gammaproteobacteria bacterium]
MGARPHSGRNRARDQIAQEAARLIIDEGVLDFALAKRKAVSRLGYDGIGDLPNNQEIESAALEYQRLFLGQAGEDRLRVLRQSALAAMQFLAPFQPQLVGPVLTGIAGENTRVTLHLFANRAEDVLLFLLDQDIPFEDASKRINIGGTQREFPTYRFYAGDAPLELVVLPMELQRRPPLSPIDGKPMPHADADAVHSLLGTASD